MEYIKRGIEEKFLRMSSFFKAVLITGSRQVGKTTMLRHLANGERTYVTLDNLSQRELARKDPELFFQMYKPPIIIDEIQYAPELFSQIKIICDESEECGLFWLTGSQQYSMMKNVRETLAGRLGILTMYGFSQREALGIYFDNELDFSASCLAQRQSKALKSDIEDVFKSIWRGGMPQLLHADAEQRQVYCDSYIDTYLMRDVAQIGGIADSVRFKKFLIACAALTAEQLSYKNLADAAEVSQPTAREWVKLLESLGIIYLLMPYCNNALKRLTKTPKLYFSDTGLCAHLSMWLTPETLMRGAAAGHYFENYVVSELIKNYSFAPSKVNLSYYRDSNAKEIAVFVEENGKVHPLEIKKSANPDAREIKKFALLDKASTPRGCGGIVCMCAAFVPIDEKSGFIPYTLL